MVAEQKRQAKEAKRERRAAEVTEAATNAARVDSLDEPDQAREVGRAINKNRGLTRERKKEDRNPRVKNREKFRKATIRRNGQVRSVASPGDGPYGGETSGIKKGVSHSTRF